MPSLALFNIGELTTNDSNLGDLSPMGRLHDAALVLDDSRVAWIGPSRSVPAADEGRDCHGCAVIPGFVDSHTHLVFDGERADEFAARFAGTSIEAGGILRTVASTRAASTDQLRQVTRDRLGALRRSGVTTVEIKSGYELSVDGERRLLDLAGEFSDECTFLGAHAIPSTYAHDRDAYVELVAGEMLAACAPAAKWTDVFCDRGAFTVDEARYILTTAIAAGLGVRLHGNQMADSGGVELAVELDAASVDHCTHVNDDDLDLLAQSNTVATLLPGAEFCTKSPYPSGRRFLDAGVRVALATDCNPGTSYVTSMPFVIALAVREMGLTPDEALWAATAGGARALRREDIGTLAVGSRGDVAILDVRRAAHLAYRPGSDHVASVVGST